jgi:DNA-binding response OmpR family regulator
MTAILVLDDDKSIRDILQLLLTAHGYTTLTAEDPAQAWELIQKLEPDMMVSDIDMPGMDGYSFLKKLRADRRFTAMPVMLLTIRSDARSAMRGLESGADEYMPKPFHKHDLLLRIRRMEQHIPLKFKEDPWQEDA